MNFKFEYYNDKQVIVDVKEISKFLTKFGRLKSQLEEAEKVIKFYADKELMTDKTLSFHGACFSNGTDCGTEWEKFDGENKPDFFLGKRASGYFKNKEN